MTKLFAIPIEDYTSNYTNEGVVYNIIDQNKHIIAQLQVAHKKYTLHDVLIDNDSSAPSNVRNELLKILNDKYDGQFEVVTALTRHMTSKAGHIQCHPTKHSVKITYNTQSDQVQTSKLIK